MNQNVLRAKLAAEKAHQGQSYDIYPYMKHIQDVVDVARTLGYDEAVQVACYLHDSMEDGNLSYNDIKTHFGEEVAEIVFAVTDELGRNRKERHEKTYPKIRAIEKAVCVKLCDRIANTQSSLKYNPRLAEMYEKEHDKFEQALFVQDHHEARRAWVTLRKICKKEDLGMINNMTHV